MDELGRVSCEPRSGRRSTAVVFVHGAWHGSWCWAEHFLPYFAEHGYPAHAFDLRGHGAGGDRRSLRRARLADYVADLDRMVTELGSPAVLVGHSMGGLVVQKYLETHDAAAAVLLASLPPSGGRAVARRLVRRYPRVILKVNTTWSLRPFVATPQLARELFFSADIPAERLREYHARLQDESLVVFIDLLALNLPDPRRIRTPVLVLGADRDAFLDRSEVEATARAYDTTPAFFPMAHDMMLEAGWQDVAAYVLGWLTERVARSSP